MVSILDMLKTGDSVHEVRAPVNVWGHNPHENISTYTNSIVSCAYFLSS